MKAVLGLIQELADFEEPDAVVITEDDLNPAFGQHPLNALLLKVK